MKHLNKIFSIVLTAAIAVSMLIAAVPVSAADNAWTEFKVPSFSKLTASGLLTRGIDGALYAYTNTATANTNSLAKSVDGGRTWTSVKTPGATAGAAAITAIATSPSEANVVYIATATEVWKSIDGGATFAAQPVGAIVGTKTLAVGLLGGSYKVFAGTAGGVFLFDEGIALNNNFVLFGGAAPSVLDVKLSPTFNTAAGIYALSADGTLRVSTGGAWSTTVVTVKAGAFTGGEIGFSADFNLTSNPVLFVGLNTAAGGVFRTIVAGTGVGGTQIGTVTGVETIDVTGSGVFGGAVTIVAGTTTGGVFITSTAGVSGLDGTKPAKNVTGGTAAFVALANDYATSGTVFALTAATAADGDEAGFSVSTNKAANFAQISLLDSSIANIDSSAFASNGDIYLTTSVAAVTTTTTDSFHIHGTFAGGTETITLGTGTVAITSFGTGTAVLAAGVWTLTFTAAGDYFNIAVVTPGTITWNAGGTSVPSVDAVVDPNGSFPGTPAPGATIALDLNSVTTPGKTSLWRNMGGKWDRIQGNQTAGSYANLAVSPNYATDKGVYNVAGAVINASVDNGVTFAALVAAPAAISAYTVLDTATFVVATGTGIYRTTNSGFIWNQVSTTVATKLVRSSDATTLVAVTAGGDVFKSVDLGATWTALLTTANGGPLTLPGVSAVTFQNGSNTVLWATTATGGIYKLDPAAAPVAPATTIAWIAQPTVAALNNGVGIASGVATSPVIYALDDNGSLTRLLGDASAAENIADAGAALVPPVAIVATKLFGVPAAGGNTLWAVTATKLYTFKDTIAVSVPNVAVASFTTTKANITFGAVAGATDYEAFIKASTKAQADFFTAANVAGAVVTVDKTALTVAITGLTSDTTYTVSVFAKTPFHSLVGSKTFATQPDVVGLPVDLAPSAGATGVAITPGFAWGAVPGATSYTVEVSTVSTFATLVGTKQTTTVPAFAWTTPALANNTTYYWRVVAITATGSSSPIVSVFTTVAAPVTTPPASTQPPVTITNTTVTLTTPAAETPAYIWAIIGIGALLVIVVIVLIVRTRRVV